MIDLTLKMSAIKKAVFSFSGRLLERQIYRFLFEGASKKSVLSALLAYQNDDGGFGNGIEPDILIPQSTAIGLETALSCFHIIGDIPFRTAERIVEWVSDSISSDGFIPHPPQNIDQYPHKPWWKNNDNSRVYSIIGLLRYLGVSVPTEISEKVSRNATLHTLPQDLREYDYPIYIYAFCLKEYPKRDEVLEDFTLRFPVCMKSNPIQFLAFSRYWHLLASLLSPSLLKQEAARFVDTINEDGLIPTNFPDLPWWNSIIVLDCLASLLHLGLLKR